MHTRLVPFFPLACVAIAVFTVSVLSGSLAKAQDPESGPQMIAVVELESSGGTDEVNTLAATDKLREELLNSGEFTLVDRSQLETVIAEQQIQQANCETADCVLEAGRILGVSKVVTGRLSKLDNRSWQISAQLLDVATARTERAESVLFEGRFVDLLREAIPELAAKLAIDRAAPPPPVVQVESSSDPGETQQLAEPSEEKPALSRIWAAPEGFVLGLTLRQDNTETDEVWSGSGLAVGLDLPFRESIDVWLALHFGSINEIEGEQNHRLVTVDLSTEEVDGSYSMFALGADWIWDNNPWEVLLGGGLFYAAAEASGIVHVQISETVSITDSRPFSTDVRVLGLLLDARLNYTFESGFLLGAGLNIGGGTASGKETEGTDSSPGSVSVFYIPLGYKF